MQDRTRGQVVSIGECMVELARGPDGRFGLAYGGDTFNAAVYLARCGVPVAYGTALGDDPYSSAIVALADIEGVATDLVETMPGRTAGLYLIETSAGGERSFHYWRDRAPARELLDPGHGDKLIAAMHRARAVLFSGVTLSLYPSAALDRFAAAIAGARAAGAVIVMDGNYRPRGWNGDTARARGVMERFWRLADIALPTFEDEAALWGDATPEATIARLASLGIAEITVKLGAAGAIGVGPGTSAPLRVPIPERVAAIDTSAAGDSFDAAYLAARLGGGDPAAAMAAGHRLAGVVVQHRGAIAPREATAGVCARLLAG